MINPTLLNSNALIECIQLKFDGSSLKSLKILKDVKSTRRKKILPLEKTIIKQLKLYFKKQLKEFNVNLKLKGTAFQISVWNELLKVPYGTTVSYTDIANRINHPKAYRAVANAIGKNPIPIIIPCHRVVHKNGNLSGYAYGDELKKFLLNLEHTY